MAKLLGRLVTCSDPVSLAIRIKTECKYSHIEFIFIEDALPTLGAHADGGVARRPINYDTFTAVWNFEIDVTQQQYNDTKAAAVAQLGKKYDFTAIAGIEFDRDWRATDSWFCSELFIFALEEGKVINRLDYSINHVTPAHALLILSSMFNVTHV